MKSSARRLKVIPSRMLAPNITLGPRGLAGAINTQQMSIPKTDAALDLCIPEMPLSLDRPYNIAVILSAS
jgi:hypothetical protein